MEIFESEYIHIGGDEIRMNNYNGDEMAPLKIIKEIKEHLHTKGKKVVVWEEVASIIDPQSLDVIMNWKDMKTGYELLKQGKKVIFCPRDFFYFDYSQKEGNQEPISIGGLVTCEKVDSFSIDNEIFANFKDNIVGIQANLWTEYMYSEDIMDYMLYPRLDHFAKLT